MDRLRIHVASPSSTPTNQSGARSCSGGTVRLHSSRAANAGVPDAHRCGVLSKCLICSRDCDLASVEPHKFRLLMEHSSLRFKLEQWFVTFFLVNMAFHFLWYMAALWHSHTESLEEELVIYHTNYLQGRAWPDSIFLRFQREVVSLKKESFSII